MFVGREEELELLNGMHERKEFQMAVIYGRRRVGKTALLEKFSRKKRTLFFTAREQSSKANLRDLSQKIVEFFNLPQDMPPFETWATAFSFIASQCSTTSPNINQSPFVFVFDEFPYAASTEPALPSTLQVAIDHEFKKTSMFLILCGSNEGFMESKVLGRKSPLFGRRNAQIRLQPFDFFDAAKMLPGLSATQLVRYYATFGGTPYYLEQIDLSTPYEQNVQRLAFSMYGMLYEEPLMLLRQELREPALYNSILNAIGIGRTKPKAIAERAGVATSSIAKYLKTLETLGIIEKLVPFGENLLTSRKGIYQFKEPFFSYWYRFVAPNVGAIETGAGAQAARACAFGEALSTYEGIQFESICKHWLVRQNKAGKLGFVASKFGKWWGTDPNAHEEVDIDVIAANKQTGNIVLGECKWRNAFNETQTVNELKHRSTLLKGYKKVEHILFTKKPISKATQEKLCHDATIRCVCVDDLMQSEACS